MNSNAPDALLKIKSTSECGILHKNTISVYDDAMFILGFSGLICGFVLGMILNGYLLRNIPKEEYTKNSNIRWKYGLLNWAIALGFMALMLYIGQIKP